MKKVLVTGAGGYIGRYVVKKLCDLQDYEIIAADVRFDGVDPRAKRTTTSLFSGEPDIYEQLECPDICIHLAWKDGFIHNSPTHMRELSHHVTFLNNMIQAGLPMLSVMGTMHEVGYWEGAIDENTPCTPLTQYGIAKNALRQSLLLSTRESACVFHWLRAFYITSNDSRGSNIFSKIVKAAEAGQKTFPFTSGNNQYDFIDIHQLAEMIVAASIQNKINGVINVCSGVPVSLKECVEKFIKEQHLNISLEYGVYPDRPYDSPAIWGDGHKIATILAAEREE